MKKMIMILAAASFVLASKPVEAYAYDKLSGAAIDTLQEEETAELSTPEDGKSDLSSAGLTAGSADIGEITAVDAPDKTEYSIPFKRALDVVLEDLPETLTVYSGDRKEVISVKWKCDGDYNERMGEYPFVPDLEGYSVADGVVLPKIIVTFDKEVADGQKGLAPRTIRHEVPISREAYNNSGATDIPASFNSYEAGKLPAVRDQGDTGTCWAHSAIGAIEADLIHNNQADTSIDLSELHLAYYYVNAYEDPKHCRTDTVKHTGKANYLQEGEFETDAQRVLANLVGAVDEKTAPFTEDPDAYHPGPEDVVSKDTAQVRNVYYINSKDVKGIKTAIMNHGGVSACYYDGYESKGEYYYNDTNASYYCPKDAGGNHAVMVVGWDDSFSRTRFNEDPGADGAWLIRNSWGDQKYSHSGYFWMSYYDKSFGGGKEETPLVAVDATTDLYANCYAYDGTPVESGNYFLMYPEDTMLVTYDVSGHEAVKAVSVEITTVDANIDVAVKNMSTGKTVKGSVKTTTAGIYTIVLDEPLEVYDKSTVQIGISGKADNGKPIGVAREDTGDYTNYEGSFTFVRVCDKGFYFDDGTYKKYDLRVKLYTDASKATYKKVKKVTVNKKEAGKKAGGSFKLKATVKPDDATYKYVKWSSSNNKIATVSENGTVKAISPGKATITAETYDQGKKAKCKITVKGTKVKSVKLKSKATVAKGKTIILKPTFKPGDATNKSVTWKSSNTKVATVNKNGKVKGIKKGSAKITVTTEDGEKTATCKVTVK